MAALFFRVKRHCGAIAERRLDCKSLISFYFLNSHMEPNNVHVAVAPLADNTHQFLQIPRSFVKI